jgi:hypothetical protein
MAILKQIKQPRGNIFFCHRLTEIKWEKVNIALFPQRLRGGSNAYV